MEVPKVSICIPAYEQVVYLERTLRSIVEQTYHDYEVIVSDDSSSDAVKDLVAEFQVQFGERLRYVRNHPAKGTPANWNSAIALAQGTYIKIMHHDDWFQTPASLIRFVETAEHGDLDFVCSAAWAVNVGRDETILHSPERSAIEKIFAHPHRLLLGNLIGPPSSIMYRRGLGITFNEGHVFVVDLEFYRDILWKTNKAAYIDEPLISSVTGSDHNVTNSCFTREIDLKENLDLYDGSVARFQPQERLELVRYLSLLFSRYAINGIPELLSLKPDLAVDGTIRSALLRSTMKQRLRSLRSSVTASAIYKRVRGRGVKDHQISYAQCGEDLIIAHVFRALGIDRPFFMDIGAHHPKYLNNTYFFYKQGATGVNIEPDPHLIKSFDSVRPKDTNLNFGVTDEPGERVADLHIFNTPTLNTFSKEEAAHVAATDPRQRVVSVEKIRIRNVNEVLADHASKRRIDLLSMDVEGLDEKLIMVWDFSRYKPLVICLETISYSATGRGVKNEAVIRHIADQGYLLYADTNVNSIFVLESEWRR
ncbi:MAG: glycosyltransferase [Flavobacteriales bacterium]